MKLFFAQLFLLIRSVSTEQSQICVTNANPAMLEPGRLVLVGQYDPLFVPTSVMKTPTLLTDDPAPEESIAKVQRTSGQGCHNKIDVIKDLY